MKNVIFTNWFHNGDIHVSRTFIREICGLSQDINFGYFHRNNDFILSDIPKIKRITNVPRIINEHTPSILIGDTLYLSTWYGTDKRRYLKKYGLTYNCLYHLFDDHLKFYFNTSLQNINPNLDYFFPDINFSNFNTAKIDVWAAKTPNKKVFLSNGKVLSGQANNFAMNNIILALANAYPNYIFVVSNIEGSKIKASNIVYSDDIIGKGGNDLNENGYLSTYCDYIIGRLSGTYTFAFNKMNLFKLNKTFISFSEGKNEGIWNNIEDFGIKYSSDIYHFTETNTDNIINIIRKILE